MVTMMDLKLGINLVIYVSFLYSIYYLLGLWKDRRLNHVINHPSFAQYVREKYIIQYIVPSHIGVIGMVQKLNLFVQIVIRVKKICPSENASRRTNTPPVYRYIHDFHFVTTYIKGERRYDKNASHPYLMTLSNRSYSLG